MFSFLKGKPSDDEKPSSATPSESPGEDGAAKTPVDHPLASMVWDAPDVPRAEPPPQDAARHGLDVGALVAPPVAPSTGPEFGEKDQARTDALKPGIVEAISSIYDPEIPVNIYELGLVYDIVSDAEGRVTVTMTLTSPACPSAQQLPSETRFKTRAVPGVTDARVDVVWEPPWSKDLMSETARMALGMF